MKKTSPRKPIIKIRKPVPLPARPHPDPKKEAARKACRPAAHPRRTDSDTE